MLLPSIIAENLLEDSWFDFPSFRELENMDRKLYGRHAAHEMKTDVREHEDHYEVDINLPGFKKDEISLDLENGYLTISAAKEMEQEKSRMGRIIRQERYEGSLQRSFFVGGNVKESDITARFENGVLTLTIPKKETPKLPDRKRIAIEG
jgi:HSP20 family molecular chaperone IbpA